MPGIPDILKNPREVFVRFISTARKSGAELPPEPNFGAPTTPRDSLTDTTIRDVYHNPNSVFSGASDDTIVVEAAREAGIIG